MVATSGVFAGHQVDQERHVDAVLPRIAFHQGLAQLVAQGIVQQEVEPDLVYGRSWAVRLVGQIPLLQLGQRLGLDGARRLDG